MEAAFAKFAIKLSKIAGTLPVFVSVLLGLFLWILYGCINGFSDRMLEWFCVVTTMPSLLMLFLLLAASNRNAAINTLKQDALLAASPHAPNEVILSHELDEDAFTEHRENLDKLAKKEE